MESKINEIERLLTKEKVNNDKGSKILKGIMGCEILIATQIQPIKGLITGVEGLALNSIKAVSEMLTRNVFGIETWVILVFALAVPVTTVIFKGDNK